MVGLEKTVENTLEGRKNKLFNIRQSKFIMLTGRSNTEALAYILWAPRMKQESWEKIFMHGKINDNKKEQKTQWLDH